MKRDQEGARGDGPGVGGDTVNRGVYQLRQESNGGWEEGEGGGWRGPA